MQGVIGEFPGCLADIMGIKTASEEKRDAAVVKRLTRRLLQGLARIHVRPSSCRSGLHQSLAASSMRMTPACQADPSVPCPTR